MAEMTHVTIVLDGEEKTLEPSFGAAKAISSRYGGVTPMIDRVLKMDLDAVATVVALGLGYLPPRQPPKDLAEQVYRTGLTDDTGGLAQKCILYLQIIAGGGRLPSAEQEDGLDEDPTDD